MTEIARLNTRRTASTAQADVPTDVWLEVIAHLEAPDVLSLQSTCKLLHNALHEKSVWISVLQRGCSRDGVYFPSYPVVEMGIKRLQRAALGPYRLYMLIESCSEHRSDPPLLKPVSSTLAATHSPRSGNILMIQDLRFLVPGGRFLLTLSPDGLSLWDLGPPDRPALSDPILVTRTAIESHPVTKKYGWPHISVRIQPGDALLIVLAIGGTLLTVYDLNPSQTSPSFRRIATVPISSTDKDPLCMTLSISDDVVLCVLGNSSNSLVWNFREGWYGFGPKRDFKSTATSHVITGKNVVIECDSFQASIWSAGADSLHTLPIISGGTIPWLDPDRIFSKPFTPVSMPHHGPRPSGPREQRNIWTILPAGLSLDGGDSVTLDMLFIDSTFQMSTAEHGQRPIRGYRYRLRPIRQLAGGEEYDVEFKQEARFNLPPNMKAFCPDPCQFPGRRGSGSIYGSTLLVHSNGGAVYSGGDPRHSFHYLYSLPNRWSDAYHPNRAAGCPAKGRNDDPQSSDDAVIQAGLTCLWGGISFQSRQMCTTSGRFLVVEDGHFSHCRIYDFLRPWNHVDSI